MADRFGVKALVTVACLLTIALLGGGATWSAFHSATTNEGNTLAIGTVAISDTAGGAALFAVAGMHPGDRTSKCLQIDYTGTAPAQIRLSGTTTAGTGLEQFLHVTITRGAGCAPFTADTVDHRGLGPGVLFSGLLSDYPPTAASGVIDPTALWSAGERHAYLFTVELDDSPDAATLTATETFTWTAH